MDDGELLDRCWDVVWGHNDLQALWDGDLADIERWPRTSSAATARAVDELHGARDEALAGAAAGGELAPSLRTVADAASLVAAHLDVAAERMWSDPEQGMHAHLYFAVNNLALRTAEDGRAYLDKLARFPAAVDELRGRLVEAAAAGRAPLARHAAAGVERIEAHLATALADDPVLVQPPPTEFDETAATRWRDEVAAAVRDHVRPALAALGETLRTRSLPAGLPDDAPGLCHLDGGEATYAALLESCTDEGLTAQQVHDIGREQVARLAEAYSELGGATFGIDDPAAVMARLRDDASLHHHDGAAVAAEARRLHRRAEEIAPDWFLRTPAAACEVRETDRGSIAFYTPPSPDGSRPGVLHFNTAKPEVWGPNLATTVFHEGIPGHHFQAALGVEAEDLHDMHRRLFLPAFGEGWALYTEQLADEIGLFEDDLQRLGSLEADSMRACRLVVDTGLHALGWSRDRAIAYMRDNSPMREAAVVAEVDRYIASPGQAASYMIGRLVIEDLRAAAASRLGDRFDAPTFHDVVLSHGMVSLPALRLVVDRWLDASGA